MGIEIVEEEDETEESKNIQQTQSKRGRLP
jgi:hypothetical protein